MAFLNKTSNFFASGTAALFLVIFKVIKLFCKFVVQSILMVIRLMWRIILFALSILFGILRLLIGFAVVAAVIGVCIVLYQNYTRSNNVGSARAFAQSVILPDCGDSTIKKIVLKSRGNDKNSDFSTEIQNDPGSVWITKAFEVSSDVASQFSTPPEKVCLAPVTDGGSIGTVAYKISPLSNFKYKMNLYSQKDSAIVLLKETMQEYKASQSQ